MSNENRAVVLLSGGMDSTTLLYYLRHEGMECYPFSVLYGQRHQCELDSAEEICHQLGLDLEIVDIEHLRSLLFKGSSQTDDSVEVPEGHYAEESMKQTVVPNRNMILLALANAYAQSIGAGFVAYAAHAGDHAIYPDCRPEFAQAMGVAFVHSGWDPPVLNRPFITWTKAQIVKCGSALDVPFELTWSCYKGKAKHCGKCGTCVERIEAFELAGVVDSTEYSQ